MSGAVGTEQEFFEHYREAALPGIRQAAVIGLMIYMAYGAWDYVLLPDHYYGAWAVRYGVVTPMLIGVIYSLSLPIVKTYLRSIILSVATLGSTSVIYLFHATNSGEVTWNSTGIMTTILFCMTMLRMLRREALVYLAIMSFELFGLLIFRDADINAWFGNLFFLGTIASIGLTATIHFERYARRVFLDEKLIRFEHDRADNLLENIFPPAIAERLKGSSRTIAEYFPEATILFADLSGFTLAASSMKASQVVEELNEIYSAFDYMTKLHGCEKIKTIGDSYMAVCGVPNSVNDHVDKIVRLALTIQQNSGDLVFNGRPLSIRIGIHTGPVVAGVIGKSRFAYDLWGDTVNVASRMQSTAPQRSIQITTAVKDALRSYEGEGLSFESRPAIEVKGKGALDVWLVRHHEQKEQSPQDAV